MNTNQKGRFISFDRLKASVSLHQVLERYRLLERFHRTGDDLTGPCPIHHGHNPTQFRVSLKRGCWICFGDCHGGGSVIDFVSRMEGVGIRDAGLLLQDWFHLQPGERREIESVQITHCSPMREAVDPIRAATNSPLRFSLGPLDGTHAYLRERGLTQETIGAFAVGACAYGTLRGWIAIPIHNLDGRVIAYAGRWPGIPPAGRPKYRLPRGFHKSIELFNQHRVKALASPEPLVVVEGFFGCMWVWQAGYRKVVSLMGSVLSRIQAERIAELAGQGSQVLLLFDGDAAGRKGCADALARLSGSLAVRAVTLNDRQQPDSLAPERLRQVLGQAAESEVAA